MERVVQFTIELKKADALNWAQQKKDTLFDEFTKILHTEKSAATIQVEAARLILSEMLFDLSQTYCLKIINVEDCFEPKDYYAPSVEDASRLPICYGYIDKYNRLLSGGLAALTKEKNLNYMYKFHREFIGWRVTALTEKWEAFSKPGSFNAVKPESLKIINEDCCIKCGTHIKRPEEICSHCGMKYFWVSGGLCVK